MKKAILFSSIGILHIFFSYNFFHGWWNSSIGTALILFLSYLIWGKGFLSNTGLQMNLKTVLKSFALATVIGLSALWIMKYIAAKHDVYIELAGWPDFYHDFFYVLNEEIVIGSIILFALIRNWNIRPLTASAGLAVFFALMHFVFYRWVFTDRGVLGISTLSTLFLVGFIRNSLILQTGHIGYSWALHFGWVIVMFGSLHLHIESNMPFAESEAFNMYLGSLEMLVISVLMAGAYLAYWIKQNKIN